MIYKVGVTGGAGSGKTLFTSFLEELGAIRIDADQVGREVVESSQSIRTALRAAFGDRFFDSSDVLKRRELGRHVFKNPNERLKLNRIVWPGLLTKIREIIDQTNTQCGLLVVDMAILFEAGVADWFDEIVLILSSDSIRKARLLNRCNWTEDDVNHCLESQGNYEQFMERCTVIENNQTVAVLKESAEHFCAARKEKIRNSLDFCL